jgi:hypothetical protein
VNYARREGLSREEYVTLICRGYLVMDRPVPEEFWDEWEAICAKQAEPKTAADLLLEIPPEPMTVWAVMHDGTDFPLYPDGPSKNGYIKLTATVPTTGLFWYFQLRKANGLLLAQFDGSIADKALVAGDSLSCMLDADAMVKLLVP